MNSQDSLFNRNAREWARRVTGGASMYDISHRAGIPGSTVNKRFATDRFTVEDVLRIARAYGENPVDALVDTGFLTPDERRGSAH